jgi:hypothetical protein
MKGAFVVFMNEQFIVDEYIWNYEGRNNSRLH